MILNIGRKSIQQLEEKWLTFILILQSIHSGFDLLLLIIKYYINNMKKEFEVICKNCGKKFTVIEEETKFPIKGDKYFCCRSCANTRYHSEETKQKIKDTLHKGIKQHKYKLANQYGEYIYGIRKCICKYCNTEFESDKFQKYCSDDCRQKSISEQMSLIRQNEIQNGTFKGWASRNITSYSEKFWKTVLDNNDIKYKLNFPIKQDDKLYNYFLDFYININNRKIDLEIDGKQHKYKDRQESDIKRDIYIKSKGIEVYRIEWNEINSDKGKLLMKEKINKFLEYLGV